MCSSSCINPLFESSYLKILKPWFCNELMRRTNGNVLPHIYKGLLLLIFNSHYYSFFSFSISEPDSTDVSSIIIGPCHQIYVYLFGSSYNYCSILRNLWMPVLLTIILHLRVPGVVASLLCIFFVCFFLLLNLGI